MRKAALMRLRDPAFRPPGRTPPSRARRIQVPTQPTLYRSMPSHSEITLAVHAVASGTDQRDAPEGFCSPDPGARARAGVRSSTARLADGGPRSFARGRSAGMMCPGNNGEHRARGSTAMAGAPLAQRTIWIMRTMRKRNRIRRKGLARRAAPAGVRYWALRHEVAEAEREEMRREIAEAEAMLAEESFRASRRCRYDEGYFRCSGCHTCSPGLGGPDYD